MPDYEIQTQSTLPSPGKLFTPGVTVIIVLMIVGFLLNIFAQQFTVNYLALTPQTCLPGRLWQLVSYPFINGDPMGLIFSGLMVLFIGSAIEREWRTGSFILLWLVVSVVCGILWLLINMILSSNIIGMGSAACSYGLIATFGLIYRRRRSFAMFASLETQHLALILIAIGILMSIMTPINLVWVAGAGVAYIYIKLRWHLSSNKTNVPPSPQGRSNGFVDID